MGFTQNDLWGQVSEVISSPDEKADLGNSVSKPL